MTAETGVERAKSRRAAASAPELLTERLRLRAHAPEDLRACHEIWRDPRVVRHITSPSDRAEVWARILRYAGHWTLLGYGYWLIERREDGMVLGEAGFADFHRVMEAPVQGLPEAGWVLRPDAHGQGYAREAMTAALDWLDDTFRAPRSFCLVAAENAPSVKLARALGYHPTHRISLQGRSNLLLQRSRPMA